MITALPELKSEWYTPIREREAAAPTRFLLRPLDGLERLNVSFTRDAQGSLGLSTESGRAALLPGLKGWENFVDGDGKPVPYHEMDRDANLKRIPAELVVELATEIFVRSVLQESERKN